MDLQSLFSMYTLLLFILNEATYYHISHLLFRLSDVFWPCHSQRQLSAALTETHVLPVRAESLGSRASGQVFTGQVPQPTARSSLNGGRATDRCDPGGLAQPGLSEGFPRPQLGDAQDAARQPGGEGDHWVPARSRLWLMVSSSDPSSLPAVGTGLAGGWGGDGGPDCGVERPGRPRRGGTRKRKLWKRRFGTSLTAVEKQEKRMRGQGHGGGWVTAGWSQVEEGLPQATRDGEQGTWLLGRQQDLCRGHCRPRTVAWWVMGMAARPGGEGGRLACPAGSREGAVGPAARIRLESASHVCILEMLRDALEQKRERRVDRSRRPVSWNLSPALHSPPGRPSVPPLPGGRALRAVGREAWAAGQLTWWKRPDTRHE
nr:uncharacterized protein LOC105884977 [Microcebus murinus]